MQNPEKPETVRPGQLATFEQLLLVEDRVAETALNARQELIENVRRMLRLQGYPALLQPAYPVKDTKGCQWTHPDQLENEYTEEGIIYVDANGVRWRTQIFVEWVKVVEEAAGAAA